MRREARYELFGGKKEASVSDVTNAISTILDRLGTIESKLSVIEERYETLAKEQSIVSSEHRELRTNSGEAIADITAKVKTLGIETAKLKEESKKIGRQMSDFAKQDEVIELRKRLELGR